MKYGAFIHPSSAFNFHYRDIVSIFKKGETWTQMLFYCKPLCKLGYDKKQYNDTIAKPSFLLKEKEREVFLNGEVKEIKKVGGYGGQAPKSIKKTMVCLLGLQVDDQLGKEAVRSVFSKEQAKAGNKNNK